MPKHATTAEIDKAKGTSCSISFQGVDWKDAKNVFTCEPQNIYFDQCKVAKQAMRAIQEQYGCSKVYDYHDPASYSSIFSKSQAFNPDPNRASKLVLQITVSNLLYSLKKEALEIMATTDIVNYERCLKMKKRGECNREFLAEVGLETRFKDGNLFGKDKRWQRADEQLAGLGILVMLPDGKYYMEGNSQVKKTWETCGDVARSLEMDHIQICRCLSDTRNKRVHYYGIQLRYTKNNFEPTEPFEDASALKYKKCKMCRQPGHVYPMNCNT